MSAASLSDINDTMVVLRARRWRRRLRAVGRAARWTTLGLLVAAALSPLVVQRSYLASCGRREQDARWALKTIAALEHRFAKANGAPTPVIADLDVAHVNDIGGVGVAGTVGVEGYRFVVTDARVGDGQGEGGVGFLVWAFSTHDDDGRSAAVINEAGEITTVQDGCGPVGLGL